MPRPKSSTSMELSRYLVTTILSPKPARASSMELERISKTECSQPSSPSEPKITPGRLRTRSAPFRAVMLSLPYCLAFAVISALHPFSLSVRRRITGAAPGGPLRIRGRRAHFPTLLEYLKTGRTVKGRQPSLVILRPFCPLMRPPRGAHKRGAGDRPTAQPVPRAIYFYCRWAKGSYPQTPPGSFRRSSAAISCACSRGRPRRSTARCRVPSLR